MIHMVRQLLANFRGTGPFLFTLLAVATAVTSLVAVSQNANHGQPYWRTWWRMELPLLACWSVLAIVLVGLRPGEALVAQRSEFVLVPFAGLFSGGDASSYGSISLTIGNALLFAPAGFFVALWRPAVLVRWVLAGSLALSFAIEVAQFLVITDRTASTEDLILNTAGAALGLAAARLIIGWRRGDSNP